MSDTATPGPGWSSALYPMREIPTRVTKPVPPGFCVTSPTKLPRSCTWCGRPMRLVTRDVNKVELAQPIVACDACDHWGAWP